MILDVVMTKLTGNIDKFSAQGLPRRRRWNYTVLAYECNQHPLSKTAELSECNDVALRNNLPVSYKIAS